MKWPRLMLLILFSGFILVTVAIQTEKPAVRLTEIRPERFATHFRQVEFVPDSLTAWAVGFEGTVLRTDDAGKTWTLQETKSNARLYGLQIIDVNTVYCCGSDGTLLATFNGGKTWKKLPVSTRYRLLDVFFTGTNTGWVVGDNGCVLHTENGCRTWLPVEMGITSGFRQIWFSPDGRGYLAGYEGVLFFTEDAGLTWKRMPLPEHISFYGMAVSDEGRRCNLVGSCGMMIESVDSGDSWKILPITTTNFLRDIYFNSTGYACAVGYGVILTKSADSDSWQKSPVNPNTRLQSVSFGSGGHGIAVGQWGLVLCSEDFGRSWTMMDEHFAPDLLDVAIDHNSGILMGVGADGWTLMIGSGDGERVLSNTGSRNTLKCCAFDQIGRFWALGSSPKNANRLTAGKTWERVSLPDEDNINDLTFTGLSNAFIVGDNGLLLASKDSGDTWYPLTRPTDRNIQGISFIDDLTGFIYGDEGMIMETRDGGITWMAHDTGVTVSFRSGMFGSNGHSLLVSDRGALESWSNGHNSSWFNSQFDQPVSSIAPGCRYLGLANGDIQDRRTGITRCTSKDPILAFVSDRQGNEIWGVGGYGRIVRLKTNDINLLLSSRTRN